MNAHELADELDKFSELGGDLFFATCADMLRFQDAKIKELEYHLQMKLVLNKTVEKRMME